MAQNVALIVVTLLPTSTALRLTPRARPTSTAASVVVGRRSALLGAGAAILAPPLLAVSAADPAIYTPPSGSLTGTTILITGANTGLGLESAKRLASAGANVIVTARSQSKADGAVRDVTAAVPSARPIGLELDLASLASVKAFPERLSAAVGGDAPIDVLLNNAGVMAVPERIETTDGFERTVGVNHLGHFALVAALLPLLKKAKDGFRIVNVSSDAHRFASTSAIRESIDANLDPEYSTWGSYGVSKAANVLFTVELQRRIEEAGLAGSAVSLHPGVVQTDLARYIIGGVAAEDTRLSESAPPPTGAGKFLKEKLLDNVVIPVSKGANTQVFLAAAADTSGDRKKRGGIYFDKMKANKANDAATNPVLAKQLWQVSEKLTGTTMEF